MPRTRQSAGSHLSRRLLTERRRAASLAEARLAIPWGARTALAKRHWTYLDQGKPVLKSEMLYRIEDPVSNTETRWDSTSKEAKVVHWPKEVTGRTACDACGAFLDVPGDVVEKLGVRTIEGLVAEGTRSTYTIGDAQGQRSPALTVIHEKWFCPELKIVILETNDDPRSGTWRNELVDIVRGEPDVTRYRPPAGYVIRDVQMPAR